MSELWQMGFAYRLAKRNGGIVLQVLWSHVFTRETEWRDVPIVELPPNKACTPTRGYSRQNSVSTPENNPVLGDNPSEAPRG